ncbi:hypothetical protein ACFX2G_024898 [Malus domestica]
MASDYVDSVDDAIDLEYESGGSKRETESEGDQEEVSVSQLLQGKRSKTWEHVRPYQVKTLVSLKDREGNVVKDGLINWGGHFWSLLTPLTSPLITEIHGRIYVVPRPPILCINIWRRLWKSTRKAMSVLFQFFTSTVNLHNPKTQKAVSTFSFADSTTISLTFEF